MALTNEQKLEKLGQHVASLVTDGMTVGLGTGSTAAAMVDALGDRVKDGLQIKAIPTSNATEEQARELGIPLVDLAEVDQIDVCIDGADEIDPDLNLVKGRGGALLFEKLVARRSDHYIIIATDDKLVQHLGTRLPLPVEIVPVGWVHTAEAIRNLGFMPNIRMTDAGERYVTDGGHVIVDCDWPAEGMDPAEAARDLKLITGVVDHGLFINMADRAFTIDENGEITEHTAK